LILRTVFEHGQTWRGFVVGEQWLASLVAHPLFADKSVPDPADTTERLPKDRFLLGGRIDATAIRAMHHKFMITGQ